MCNAHFYHRCIPWNVRKDIFIFLAKFTLLTLVFVVGWHSHSWGFSFEVDCHDVLLETVFNKKSIGKIHTAEASLWGGLSWSAVGDCIAVEICFGKIHITLETSLWCGLNFTLMRLLFEVDCHYVLLETAFQWKSFGKIHTHEGFSLRWIVIMCCWKLHFCENIFWQIYTLETSLWGELNFTLMRLLLEVDCHDVLLETTFLCMWKCFLAKFTLLRLLFEVDCFGDYLSSLKKVMSWLSSNCLG